MAEKVIAISGAITVGDLAEMLNLPVTTLVGELFKNGIVATINQKIDFETVSILVEELGLDVDVQQKAADTAQRAEYAVSERASERAPIVAVMGHVDHGKTSLLDAILDMKVVDGEAGGITQHISAYQTIRKDRPITLLDTPGHEAFAALRQHGAALTDVVIIVVAADDGVKPQTIEAIKFAKSANAKIVVAINKIDKEAADSARVKAQLASEHGLNPEEWGGETIMVEVSAKTGEGIDKLLDMVLLVADLEELKADTDVPARGLVIEAHMATGRGPVVSLLIEHGMLRPGMFLSAGTVYGKIRTLQDYAGRTIKEAGPATPVTITGLKELPQFGDSFLVQPNEKIARSVVAGAKIAKEQAAASTNVTGSDMLRMISRKNESQEFNVIVKADVQGSLTSVIDSLKLIDTNDEIALHVIGSGVGNISENDIRLAADEKTIVYGFNVTLPPAVKQLAARDGVQVRIYSVIYELLDDARNSMEAMLAPEVVETPIGSLAVKGIFKTTKEMIIAGGEVLDGKVYAGLNARVERKGEVIGEVSVASVQREKIEAKEVFAGDMCGLNLKTTKKLVIEEGDTISFFIREVVKRTLK